MIEPKRLTIFVGDAEAKRRATSEACAALRRRKDTTFVVVQYPECGLHPSAQRIAAIDILRRAAEGTYTVLLTHSDVVLQCVNNAVKLASLGAEVRERAADHIGWPLGVYLGCEDVAAYSFDVEGYTRSTTKLEVTSRGVSVPSFNRALAQLAEETLYLRDLLDEAEK